MACVGCENYAKRITNIFRDQDLKTQYADLTGYKILQDSFLCDDCNLKLEAAYEFKQKCIQIYLRQNPQHETEYEVEEVLEQFSEPEIATQGSDEKTPAEKSETLFVINEIQAGVKSMEKPGGTEVEEFIVGEIAYEDGPDDEEYSDVYLQYEELEAPPPKPTKSGSILSRKSYTVQEKLQIIQYAEDSSNRQAARFYDMNESTVRCFRLHKETLLKMNPERRTNRRANPHWPHLEEDLKKFVENQASLTGKGVSLKDIKKKAIEIAGEQGIKNFNGTNSYIFKFMQRHSLPCASPRPRKKIKLEN